MREKEGKKCERNSFHRENFLLLIFAPSFQEKDKYL
jgi:hypothetical protein